MRTINFTQGIIYGMAHLLGIDPEQDLLKDHARAWVASVNSKVRYAWTFWPWPELEVTEERAFRQIWQSDVDYFAGRGEDSESYFIPAQKYYRAIADSVGGTPRLVQSAPGSTLYIPKPQYFAEMTEPFDRHIAFEQPGKQSIEMILDIGKSNPRTANSSGRWSFTPSGLGIDVPFGAGPTVWVTFLPRPPLFTTTTYRSNKAYARGDVVLDNGSGDCYIALAASEDKALTLAGFWLRQDFPYFLSEYVKYAAAADQTDDIQTRIDLSETAKTMLEAEISKLARQGQRTKYRRFGMGTRQRVAWPEMTLVTTP